MPSLVKIGRTAGEDAGARIAQLYTTGVPVPFTLAYPTCVDIFRKDKGQGTPLRFHKHQVEAFDAARRGENYVLTTGTGSGKTSLDLPAADSRCAHAGGR